MHDDTLYGSIVGSMHMCILVIPYTYKGCTPYNTCEVVSLQWLSQVLENSHQSTATSTPYNHNNYEVGSELTMYSIKVAPYKKNY